MTVEAELLTLISLPLFVFGTLLDAKVRYRVLGRTIPHRHLRDAVVKVRERCTVAGRDYPMLCRAPRGRVWGKVIRHLTEQDWTLLDHYEGSEYVRSPIAVWTKSGKRLDAVTYLCPPHVKASRHPWTP